MKNDDFHDSESGDIYDLYNACNGVFVGDLLDIDQLNTYTPEEAKELNVIRLREVWEHTKTNCSQCREIIRGLDRMRGVVKNISHDIHSGIDQDPDSDIDHTESIS